MSDHQIRTVSSYDNKLQPNKGQLPPPDLLNAEKTFEIYELLRQLLPVSSVVKSDHANTVRDILDRVDGLILDGYGIINIGNRPTPEITNFFAEILHRDIPFIILTNGASFPSAQAAEKYKQWGLPIKQSDIISSRDVFESHLLEMPHQKILRLNLATAPLKNTEEVNSKIYTFEHSLKQADAFAFMGSVGWTERDQVLFESALRERPRPVFVANPDVSAPQEKGFSAEPGYWIARAMMQSEFPIKWFGKPHPASFEMAVKALQEKSGYKLDRSRIAMIGDSLHTDILGANAAGLMSVLVTNYGLMRGLKVEKICRDTSIHPHIISPIL